MTNDRILLLEDEMLIGLDLKLTLEERGYDVMGPFQTGEAAERALDDTRPAFALLDINLGWGRTSLPLAQKLHQLGIPIAFLTGYSRNIVDFPDELQNVHHISKPVREDELFSILAAELA